MNLEVDAHADSRPLPRRDTFSGPFWDAAQRHQLALQRCDFCDTFRFYPRPMCPECHALGGTWTECTGTGEIYSFTVVRRPLARWFKSRMPLICAVVELDEGVRMMTNVIGVEPDDVRIGLPVEVTFEDIDEEITLPWFRPVGSNATVA